MDQFFFSPKSIQVFIHKVYIILSYYYAYAPYYRRRCSSHQPSGSRFPTVLYCTFEHNCIPHSISTFQHVFLYTCIYVYTQTYTIQMCMRIITIRITARQQFSILIFIKKTLFFVLYLFIYVLITRRTTGYCCKGTTLISRRAYAI